MKDNLLLIIAIAAVCVSLIAAGMTYFFITNLAYTLTGYDTLGQANLTVESSAAINFTTSYISWGSGRVSVGTTAQLTTLETGNVSGGNWTLAQSGGLRIENVGNVNVTLNLSVGKSAASFIGGTSPGYQWNISNVNPSSCLNDSGRQIVALNVFFDTSTATRTVCSPFQFGGSNDHIRIDLNLTIPENSLTGALTDTITAGVYTY